MLSVSSGGGSGSAWRVHHHPGPVEDAAPALPQGSARVPQHPAGSESSRAPQRAQGNHRCVHVLVEVVAVYMFLNETQEGRKKEASKVKQTNKEKQHSTPKEVTSPRKNELPRVHVHVIVLAVFK